MCKILVILVYPTQTPMQQQEEILGKAISIIAKAIDRHSAIVFRNANNERQVVEPFVLGLQKGTNNCILKCYRNFPIQEYDKNEHWETIEIDKIHGLQIMPVRAKSNRTGYDKLLPDVDKVIACVSGYERVFA